jgi:hypothetical protein
VGAFVLEYIHWTVSFTINAAAHTISVFYIKATYHQGISLYFIECS